MDHVREYLAQTDLAQASVTAGEAVQLVGVAMLKHDFELARRILAGPLLKEPDNLDLLRWSAKSSWKRVPTRPLWTWPRRSSSGNRMMRMPNGFNRPPWRNSVPTFKSRGQSEHGHESVRSYLRHGESTTN